MSYDLIANDAIKKASATSKGSYKDYDRIASPANDPHNQPMNNDNVTRHELSAHLGQIRAEMKAQQAHTDSQFSELKSMIASMQSNVSSDISSLKGEITGLKGQMDGMERGLKGQMDGLARGQDNFKWMIGILIAAASVLVGVIKLVPDASHSQPSPPQAPIIINVPSPAAPSK